MSLDDILTASESSAPASIAAPTTKSAAPTTKSAPASVVTIKHETALTTLTALAEYYDGKRDKAVENMARTLNAYGAEVQKRGTGMTAAHAAPFLSEVRRYLDIADTLYVSADQNRKLANEAR